MRWRWLEHAWNYNLGCTIPLTASSPCTQTWHSRPAWGPCSWADWILLIRPLLQSQWSGLEHVTTHTRTRTHTDTPTTSCVCIRTDSCLTNPRHISATDEASVSTCSALLRASFSFRSRFICFQASCDVAAALSDSVVTLQGKKKRKKKTKQRKRQKIGLWLYRRLSLILFQASAIQEQ